MHRSREPLVPPKCVYLPRIEVDRHLLEGGPDLARDELAMTKILVLHVPKLLGRPTPCGSRLAGNKRPLLPQPKRLDAPPNYSAAEVLAYFVSE